MDVNINVNDTDPLADKIIRENLVANQITSYNQTMIETIPNFVEGANHVIKEQVGEHETVRHSLQFSGYKIVPATLEKEEELMFPNDARLNGYTYEAKLLCSITQNQEFVDLDGVVKKKVTVGQEKDVPFATIPIMVRSKICNLALNPSYEKTKMEDDLDPGGYFIIASKAGIGSEKVIMSLEKMKPNQCLIFHKKEQNTKILTAQIHSQNYSDTSGNMQMLSIKMKKDGFIELTIPQFQPVSIFTLLRAYGLDTDKDIIDCIVGGNDDIDMTNQVRLCIDTPSAAKDGGSAGIFSQEDAANFMMKKIKTSRKYSESNPELAAKQKRMHLDKILTKDILPHIGTDHLKKAYFICYMIRRLLLCKLRPKQYPIDDRDSFANKRIELPGPLLMQLFILNFKKMLGDCRRQFDSRGNDDPLNPPNVISQIKPGIIKQGIRSCLAIGSWGASKTKKGVSQTLSRLSYPITISSLRKIMSPSADASTNKLTSPRHLHSSQDGVLCPVEVPEGAKTGLIKNLTLSAAVSLMLLTQVTIIKEILASYVKGIKSTPLNLLHQHVKVFFNGEWLGMALDPVKLMKEMREFRFSGKIDKTVSLSFNPRKKEINIYCDGGRLYRPLLTVIDGKLVYTKKIAADITKMTNMNEVLTKYPYILEYIDVEELATCMLAMYPEQVSKQYELKQEVRELNPLNRHGDNKYLAYTHCEIHPYLKLGVIASTIPFCNHNQSPRNIFQYSQMKQGMGIYNYAYLHRLDISYILYHSQVPIVAPRAIKYTGQDKCHGGENIIVAIASYGGSNQEDSIIINASAVSRGLFRAKALDKKGDDISANSTTAQHDVFMKPTPETVGHRKNFNYEKLNLKGYVPEETVVVANDAVIGKGTPNLTSGPNSKPFIDASTVYKKLIPGVIDKVWAEGKTPEGYPQYNIRIRMVRIPVMGDKLSSRAGQKGTIGIMLPQEDMPMTENGIVPDIIINPNCLPKRMTIGQIMEAIAGKIAVLEGMDGDATPFNFSDIELMKDKLETMGLNREGTEKMYNGFTGEEIDTQIFIAPVYYQRLKHMVHDKIHSRARGPKDMITRQPKAGRAAEGGLRAGEMERDSMISHGISMFLKERFMECSDLYHFYVCDSCGLIASKMKDKDVYYCQNCNNSTETSKVAAPYAFKLMVQELAAINLALRIRTKK